MVRPWDRGRPGRSWKTRGGFGVSRSAYTQGRGERPGRPRSQGAQGRVSVNRPESLFATNRASKVHAVTIASQRKVPSPGPRYKPPVSTTASPRTSVAVSVTAYTNGT